MYTSACNLQHDNGWIGIEFEVKDWIEGLHAWVGGRSIHSYPFEFRSCISVAGEGEKHAGQGQIENP
jgi:hypothetical protein